ncbi:MAG: hypothetical protein JST54_30045 [Deltaproteobacteria bacterium]|nr:hypothetical protein [Deltaproteobacteria bacterium]
MKTTILVALTMVALGSTARAENNLSRWEVDASAGAAYVTDPSFDLVGGNDALAAANLRANFAPGWMQRRIEISAGFQGNGEGGSTFETWQTSLTVRTLQLGLIYRQPLRGPFLVYGRAVGLFDFDHLELWTTDNSLHLQQTTHTGGVEASVGAEVIAVTWERASLGFNLEVGYALRFAAASFDTLKPDDGSAKPTPVAFAAVNVGGINLSGIQWRLGAAVHF